MDRDDSWPPRRIVVHFELALDRPRNPAGLLRAVAMQENLERYYVARCQHEDLRLVFKSTREAGQLDPEGARRLAELVLRGMRR
jgi:hypothetical protein